MRREEIQFEGVVPRPMQDNGQGRRANLERAVLYEKDDNTSMRKLAVRYENGLRYIDKEKLKHYLLLDYAVRKRDFEILKEILYQRNFDRRRLRAKKYKTRERLFKEVESILRSNFVQDTYKYYEQAVIINYLSEQKRLQILVDDSAMYIDNVSFKDACRVFRFETSYFHGVVKMRCYCHFILSLKHYKRDYKETIMKMIKHMLESSDTYDRKYFHERYIMRDLSCPSP